MALSFTALAFVLTVAWAQQDAPAPGADRRNREVSNRTLLSRQSNLPR